MTGWAQLPPHDLDAEEVVVSMALWGDIRPSTAGLRQEHFYSPDYARVWNVVAAAERAGHYEVWQIPRRRVRGLSLPLGGQNQRPAPVLRLVVQVLARLGLGRKGAAELVLRLMDRAPIDGGAAYVRRLREAARRRWLCGELVALGAAVRAGEAPDGRAVARIWASIAYGGRA